MKKGFKRWRKLLALIANLIVWVETVVYKIEIYPDCLPAFYDDSDWAPLVTAPCSVTRGLPRFVQSHRA